MHKLLAAVLAAVFLVSLSSCVTVQAVKAVKPGRTLSADTGYIAIVFANKVDPIALGLRKVYAVVRQMESGRRFYVPFGFNNELRLIAAAPGGYRIEDFVTLVGFGSVKNIDTLKEQEGVLYGAPQVSGATLVSADYPDNLKQEFTVNTGEIVYLGDYSWKVEFSITGSGVLINRSITSDTGVYYAVREAYPDMPDKMMVVSPAD